MITPITLAIVMLLQPESQNNETEIQFHWTAEAEILSVIQKSTVEISPYKSADHKSDQYQDDQNPINSLQGSSSSFFCVLSMAEQSPREPVFHTSFYTITKSFFCTQI